LTAEHARERRGQGAPRRTTSIFIKHPGSIVVVVEDDCLTEFHPAMIPPRPREVPCVLFVLPPPFRACRCSKAVVNPEIKRNKDLPGIARESAKWTRSPAARAALI